MPETNDARTEPQAVTEDTRCLTCNDRVRVGLDRICRSCQWEMRALERSLRS